MSAKMLDRMRTRDGKLLNVRQHGNGPVSCLLVHGFAEGSYIWSPCVRSFGESVRSVAIDLRGHGDSDWDKASNYSIQTHTADVNDLLSLMGNGGHILIGHSMGAHVLTRLTALHPEKAVALVLVDFGPSVSANAMQRVQELLSESLRGYESVAEYAQWLKSTRPLVSPELVQHLAAHSLRSMNGGFRLKIDPALLETIETSNSHDEDALWQIIGEITCPVLLIRGAGSAMFSPQTARRMIGTLRNGRLVTVPVAGHGVMMDNPREFNDALSQFVRTYASR